MATETVTETLNILTLSDRRTVTCLVGYEDASVQRLVVEALKSRMPTHAVQFIKSLDEYSVGPLLQFSPKEMLDFDQAFHQPGMLVNAYVTRDALIRKHCLGETYAAAIAKNPHSLLKTNVKTIVNMDFGSNTSIFDVLDGTLLGDTLMRNEDKSPDQRVWWMLRPDMPGCDQDLKLFSTVDELEATFEEWDADRQPAAPEVTEIDYAVVDKQAIAERKLADAHADVPPSPGLPIDTSGGWSSWFKVNVTVEETHNSAAPARHIVAQRYVTRPLKFDARKFQVSAYVVCAGALQVYVYKPMLALFAQGPFRAPWQAAKSSDSTSSSSSDLEGHSTFNGSVRSFWELPDAPAGWKDSVFKQVCAITGELFTAATGPQMKAKFQPLPQGFEIYSVNFAVDEHGKAMLADVHAAPEFPMQSSDGSNLEEVMRGLFEEVVDCAVKPFFGFADQKQSSSSRIVKVVDLDLKRK